MNLSDRIAAADKLPEPARTAAEKLLATDATNPTHREELAGHAAAAMTALTDEQFDSVIGALLPGWVPAVRIARQSCGAIPLLLPSRPQAGATQRRPNNPSALMNQFVGSLRVLACYEPFDAPLGMAKLIATLPSQYSQAIGALVGCAADVPGLEGDQVFEALCLAARTPLPGISECVPQFLGDHLVAALASSQRPAAWQLLRQLEIDWRFGDYSKVAQFAFAGHPGCMRYFVENVESLSREMAKPVPGMHEVLAMRRERSRKGWQHLSASKVLSVMLDPARRMAVYDNGKMDEITEALRFEALLDVNQVPPILTRLMESPDPMRRALGISECRLTGQSFPPKLFGDPDLQVRLTAILHLDRAAGVKDPAVRSEIARRIWDMLQEHRGTVVVRVSAYAVTSELLLEALIDFLYPAPLDRLARFFPQMSNRIRSDLARTLGYPPDRKPTLMELGMLGLLLKQRGEAKQSAQAAIARLGVTQQECEAAASHLPPEATQPKPVEPAKGKWRKLFDKRAAATADTYTFGSPATTEQLAGAQRDPGLPLPEMLADFFMESNGAWGDGGQPITVGDAGSMALLTSTVRNALKDYDEPKPSVDHVIFFADLGDGDYWGVCAQPAGRQKAGEIVRFDHESGTLVKEAKDLRKWITTY